MKRLLSLIITISFVCTMLTAKELEKISLQLQWLNQFQFAGYYIAKEKGFYKEAGLDVKINNYKIGDDVAQIVTSGQSQYGIGRSSLVIDGSEGKDIRLVAAIFQSSPLVLVAKKSYKTRYMRDLEHKRFMLNGVKKSASIFAMLASRNIYKKDINIIQGNNAVKNLIDNKVDVISAYKSNEIYTLRKDNIDIKVFDPKDYGFDFYSDILFTNKDEAINHKQRVVKFRNASIKGWTYAFNHILESVDLIYRKYNSQNKTRAALLYEAKVLRKLAYYNTHNLGSIDKDKLQRIYDIYNVMGYIKRSINLDKLLFQEKGNEITLTKKEKQYLKMHPVIKAHNEKNWPPFNYNINGKAKGFSVDYMNLLAKKLHIKVKYISGYSWNTFMKLLQTSKLDVIINIAKNKKRSKNISFTNSFYTAYSAIYVNSNNPNFNNLKELKNKKVAVTKGFYIQSLLTKYYPTIKQILVKSQIDALKLLSLGKVDAVLGKKAVIDFLVAQHDIPSILVTNYIKDKKIITNIRMGVAKSDIVLRNILQKAQDAVTDKELENLKQKWFGVETGSNIRSGVLTKKEKSYLKRKRIIKVCTNPNWTPIEFRQNGKPQGISIDTIKIIAKRLRVKLQFVSTESWNESQRFLRDRKCDILPAAIKTKERQKYARFTKPYLTYNLAIITEKNKPLVDKLDSITNKTMSRKKGSGLISKLKIKYPNLKIIETKGYKEAFEDVEKEKAYFTISTIPVLSYYKKKYNFENLQISGYTTMKYQLCVAVRKDHKILLGAINKALMSISKDTHNVISDKWTSLHVVKQYDYGPIWKISLFFILVLLIFIFSYSKQKKLKNKLEKLNSTLEERIKKEVEKNRYQDQKLFEQSRLAQMGEMLSMIAHQWRQPLAAISATTSNLKFKIMLDDLDTKVFEEEIDLIDSYSQHLSRTIDDFRNFFKENKTKKIVTLESMLESALSIVGKSLENKNITVIKSFACKKKLEVYPNEIIQVLLNLIKNAEDILMEKKIKNPTITLSTECKKEILTLKIEDNAGGIPENIKEKIFDPYFSTKMEKDGTGLGLYMSKIIIEKHCNGNIYANNGKNGAIFTMKFKPKPKKEISE